MSEKKSSYEDAGVNLDAADEATDNIKNLVCKTFTPGVLSEVGLFGGLFKLDNDKYKEPVLVSSADGVGTKLKLAFITGRHDTVGQCLVNHCVDDILAQGAEPLFFLDYFATGKLDPDVVSDVVRGLSTACQENGCALIGGETAEMPDFYTEGEYDIAGFIVGVVEKEKILDGSKISDGDVLIGLPSNGLHTNGYSLARKIVFTDLKLPHDKHIEELGCSMGEELLKVHKSYLKSVKELLDEDMINGIAHITGGGFEGNISRIISDGLTAVVDVTKWDIPPVFRYLMEKGSVSKPEMYRVFNMGIGMVLAIPGVKVDKAIASLKDMGEHPIVIGNIEKGTDRVILKGL